jgi:hypothetical protein
VENYCRAEQATGNNVAHVQCMLDTYGYRDTQSQYVILITFPLQQWLHERASMLRYMYMASLIV